MFIYFVKRRKNIPRINIAITIKWAFLYDEVWSNILPIIHGAETDAQIPKKDKVPKILPNDFNPKHSVIFNEIKAPNPPNPIPKIIIPIHIPKIFPNDKRITDNPIDWSKTEMQVISIEEYFSLNLPKNNLLKIVELIISMLNKNIAKLFKV